MQIMKVLRFFHINRITFLWFIGSNSLHIHPRSHSCRKTFAGERFHFNFFLQMKLFMCSRFFLRVRFCSLINSKWIIIFSAFKSSQLLIFIPAEGRKIRWKWRHLNGICLWVMWRNHVATTWESSTTSLRRELSCENETGKTLVANLHETLNLWFL